MNSVCFVIPGVPVAKGRPRFRVFRGFVQSYTPKKTHLAEKNVKEAFQKAYPLFKPQLDMFTGPLRIDVRFYMPVPVSISKKKKNELYDHFHIIKPDIDNLLKTVCDGLNGVVWEDDKQIAKISCSKRYVVENEDPHTEVLVEEIE